MISRTVSVPSRGNWGFLRECGNYVEIRGSAFPSPLEVTGVSY